MRVEEVVGGGGARPSLGRADICAGCATPGNRVQLPQDEVWHAVVLLQEVRTRCCGGSAVLYGLGGVIVCVCWGALLVSQVFPHFICLSIIIA